MDVESRFLSYEVSFFLCEGSGSIEKVVFKN